MKMRNLVLGAVVSLGLAGAAAAAETALTAKLAGADAKASGMAKVRVDDKNQVCWDLSSKGLTEVTAAHIHKGAAGANGPPVVPFSGVDASGASKGCATASADVAKDLVANPGGYYVNVHTKAAPGGAIRGQLKK
jgi:hypothetical protein